MLKINVPTLLLFNDIKNRTSSIYGKTYCCDKLGYYKNSLTVIAIAELRKYLGLSEKETFGSWTIMTTLLAIVGFLSVFVVSLFV